MTDITWIGWVELALAWLAVAFVTAIGVGRWLSSARKFDPLKGLPTLLGGYLRLRARKAETSRADSAPSVARPNLRAIETARA